MVNNKMEVKETDMDSENVKKTMAIVLEAHKQHSVDKVNF